MLAYKEQGSLSGCNSTQIVSSWPSQQAGAQGWKQAACSRLATLRSMHGQPEVCTAAPEKYEPLGFITIRQHSTEPVLCQTVRSSRDRTQQHVQPAAGGAAAHQCVQVMAQAAAWSQLHTNRQHHSSAGTPRPSAQHDAQDAPPPPTTSSLRPSPGMRSMRW
jgi:hypothetical protein